MKLTAEQYHANVTTIVEEYFEERFEHYRAMGEDYSTAYLYAMQDAADQLCTLE